MSENRQMRTERGRRTWPNPQGACVDVSPARSSRSAKRGLQVKYPSRAPGAMFCDRANVSIPSVRPKPSMRGTFENVSRRMTRPW